ncbi:hypothetical protein I8752_24075 [Nostocaceae cyanobacterium CENA369]|uniref:Tetratricopeptide repeat protein n=1 Tax=Dendronalium phyllosphericum CENA369 TaxID=1725256 RepID=A0A8J7LHH7_9NOST|nr:hypothetical protein [Dendronalium phyllosphericum]MBH8576019.1 hypothetical protein [Dendronalium phyllosphericum CENA369]
MSGKISHELHKACDRFRTFAQTGSIQFPAMGESYLLAEIRLFKHNISNMNIIEQTQDKLILCSQDPFWWALVFVIFYIPSSLLMIGAIAVTLKDSKYLEIVSIGMGCLFVVPGLWATIALSEVTTYTLDKSKNFLFIDKYNRLRRSKIKSVEIPSHLILGVEIEAFSGDEGGIGYYPELILAFVYWRIRLKTDTQYQSAVNIAKTIAHFLDVPYFAVNSKNSPPTYAQKIYERRQPEQETQQYLESEIERLQNYLNECPDDGEAHQNLGIFLRHYNSWPMSDKKEAIAHLQEAERLFESQKNSDRAAIAKVLQTFLS